MKKKAQSPVDVCDRPSGHCEEFHEIRTRVSLVAMGAHPDAFGMRVVELSVVVADTGVGIAPEDVRRLGRPFEQAGEMEQRRQGTGLGLSLVRAFAELHGGRMSIDSTLGEGTAVTVRLPVAQRSALLVPAHAITSSPSPTADPASASARAPGTTAPRGSARRPSRPSPAPPT